MTPSDARNELVEAISDLLWSGSSEWQWARVHEAITQYGETMMNLPERSLNPPEEKDIEAAIDRAAQWADDAQETLPAFCMAFSDILDRRAAIRLGIITEDE